jgi:hypothetical protein
MSSPAGPFRLSVPDVFPRLTRTRWPDRETVPGPQPAEIQAPAEYWRAGYD